MAVKCCDGTGYTGKPGVICPEHYESNTLSEFGEYGTDWDY